MPEISETLKGSFTKFFGTVRQKKFRRKLVIPPIMHKIFRYPKFSETLKGCPRNFSALWDKKFSTENCDTPYYAWNFSIPQIFWNIEGMSTKFFGTVRPKIFDRKTWYPLVCIKFFDTPNFLKHWRDAHEIFRHCETKNFRRKNVIPPIMHETFRYPKFSETLKGYPRNFSALWDQKFSTEKRDTPFSFIKLFETKNFLKNSRIPLRKFSALWDIKISTENRDMPPLVHKFFSIPENFRKTEGFLYKAFRFGPVRQKVPTKPWRPPSYAWKFSIKEFFWNTKVFSNEIFWYSETKTSTENRDTPPLIQTFSIPEIIATVKDSSTEYFGTVRQKIFDGKSWYSPPPRRLLSINFLATGNFLKHSTEGFTYQIFRHCETKNFDRKSKIVT